MQFLIIYTIEYDRGVFIVHPCNFFVFFSINIDRCLAIFVSFATIYCAIVNKKFEMAVLVWKKIMKSKKNLLVTLFKYNEKKRISGNLR